MSDMLYSGTRFRTRCLLDEGSHEELPVEVALSLQAICAPQVRDQRVAPHVAQSTLRCDNMIEFASVELAT